MPQAFLPQSNLRANTPHTNTIHTAQKKSHNSNVLDRTDVTAQKHVASMHWIPAYAGMTSVEKRTH